MKDESRLNLWRIGYGVKSSPWNPEGEISNGFFHSEAELSLRTDFMAHTKTVRLILGDQLNERHSWFAAPDDSVL
jgi:hypothetical protein